MSLHYPFLFPHSEEGWHMKIPLAEVDLINNINLQAPHCIHIEEERDDSEPNDNAPYLRWRSCSRASQAQYYAFQFQNRDGVFSPILHVGRLNQEYVVDAWVYIESNISIGPEYIK